MSLIETWCPTFDVRSRHRIAVAAPPDRVHAAIGETDFGRQPLVSFLMGLRLIPALLARPRLAWSRLRTPKPAPGKGPRNLLLDAFIVLEDRPPEGVAIGLTGRFWTLSGGLVRSTPERFGDAIPAGHAQAVWTFEIEPREAGGSWLATETRVRCADDAARSRFRVYWACVAPGSALIRHAILRSIRDQAERGGPW